MSRTESTFSERVGARISPELKMGLRELVDTGVFDSEADAVREALWQYVEQKAVQAGAVPSDGSDGAAPQAKQSASAPAAEWLMSALFMLVALVGSHILNALRSEQVTPSALADEAIQETIYNHQILSHKLNVARQIAEKADVHNPQEVETG